MLDTVVRLQKIHVLDYKSLHVLHLIHVAHINIINNKVIKCHQQSLNITAG